VNWGWLASIQATLLALIGRGAATGLLKTIFVVEPQALTICHPTIIREGRGTLFSPRTIAHAKDDGIDFTPL
jgi:hypothetical protein